MLDGFEIEIEIEIEIRNANGLKNHGHTLTLIGPPYSPKSNSGRPGPALRGRVG